MPISALELLSKRHTPAKSMAAISGCAQPPALDQLDGLTLLLQAGQQYCDAISSVLAGIDPRHFQQALELMAPARRVVVWGTSLALLPSLSRTGKIVTCANDVTDLSCQFAQMDMCDVCLLVVLPGHEFDAAYVAELACERGMFVIAVAGRFDGPLTGLADVLLAPCLTFTGLKIPTTVVYPWVLYCMADALAIGLRTRQRVTQAESRETT